MSASDKSKLDAITGTNTGDETTATIKTKLGAATTSSDGYLTSADWNTFDSKQDALGFTPENVNNKVTSISGASTDTQYPSAKLVYDQLGLKAATDQSFYLGTTQIAINRSSGTQSLSGITGIDGTATNLSGTPALPDGTSATTQTAGDGSTKLATTAYVDNGLSGKINNYGSQTANLFLASPNGVDGLPSFRAIVADDIPTLNQNTTGTASNVTGMVAVANGGTGVSSFGGTNTLLYTSSASTLGSVTTANDGILVTNGSGVPSIGNIVGAALTMPSINLSATSNQLVMQGTGATGTLSWNPTTADKTITFPDESGTVALVGGPTSWSTLGNASTSPATNFIGTTDNQDMVFRTNNVETMRIEASTGDMIFGGPAIGTLKATEEINVRQDDDEYGSSILQLRNRTGENGAIFETVSNRPVGDADLVDFIFRSSPVDIQRNIRFEARTANAKTGNPSFHIGGATGLGAADPDNPTLSIGDNYSAFNKPLRIGNYTLPTALLHLAAGTAAANTAPLKLTAGTNLTSAEAGAIEYDGGVFYSSPTNSSRGVSPSEFLVALAADNTGVNNTSAQQVFNNGITLSSSTSYMFEGQYIIRSTGNNSASIGTSFLLGGGASIASITYTAVASKNDVANVHNGVRNSYVTTVNNTTLTDADIDNDYIIIILKGIVRVNTGGTFTPRYQFSNAPGAAPVVLANSYFKIYPIGTNSVTNVGNWN